MGLTVVLSLAAMGAAYYVYVVRPGLATQIAKAVWPVYKVVRDKYYVDEAYNFLFVRPGKALADWLWRGVDQKAIDGAVNGTGGLVALGASWVRRVQTGYIRNYALTLLVGIVVVVAYFISR
jgi:NADH-quinone oxidoreductase subunit L